MGINGQVDMQKWEYTILEVSNWVVVTVNEQRIAEHTVWGNLKGGRSLFRLLNELGKEGWEVTGVSPTSGSGAVPIPVEVIVILKRPLS